MTNFLIFIFQDGLGFVIKYSISNLEFGAAARLDRLKLFDFPANPKPVTVLLNNQRWRSGDWYYNKHEKVKIIFNYIVTFD